jgi:two-component system cell cycle sensor histidine kinase PleC
LRRDGAGERVRVAVSDTGIGISPEDLARLAKPFEQIESQHSKTQQGTGLGLALTKSLVEMHDGRLELASIPGEGTTVSFTLPLRHTELGGVSLSDMHAA